MSLRPRLPLFAHVLSLELRNAFSYRLEFWFSFLGMVVAEFLIAWFLWSSIFAFRQVESIGGYTFQGMMVYYLVVPMIFRCVRGSDEGFFSQEIYQGALTRYLVYPMSYFSYKFAGNLASRLVGFVQFALIFAAVLLFVQVPPEMRLTPLNIALGLGVVLVSGVLWFCIAACVELTAFWADNVWSLAVMLRMLNFFLGGVAVPLSLFPETLRPLVETLPFALMISFPLQVMTGSLGVEQMLLKLGGLLVWIGLFAGALSLVWARGTRQYTGVGL